MHYLQNYAYNPAIMTRKLSPKQQIFVAEFLVDLNASQAAIRAGYAPKRADQIGYENLRKPDISAAIQQAMSDREKRTGITADRVLKELAKVAFGDPRTIMAWGPGGVKIKESSTLTDDQAAFVSEVSESVTESSRTLKLKTNDKLKACELIGRHLGMFKDKILIGLENLSDSELKEELAFLICEAVPGPKSDV